MSTVPVTSEVPNHVPIQSLHRVICCELYLCHTLRVMCQKRAVDFMLVPAQAYGRTTYLITTLKTVPRGTEGAVSLEGTAAGIAAAALFAGGALALRQV